VCVCILDTALGSCLQNLYRKEILAGVSCEEGVKSSLLRNKNSKSEKMKEKKCEK